MGVFVLVPEVGLIFGHRQAVLAFHAAHASPGPENPGREKATLLPFLFRPSSPLI